MAAPAPRQPALRIVPAVPVLSAVPVRSIYGAVLSAAPACPPRSSLAATPAGPPRNPTAPTHSPQPSPSHCKPVTSAWSLTRRLPRASPHPHATGSSNACAYSPLPCTEAAPVPSSTCLNRSMQAFIKMSIMVDLLSPHTSQETPARKSEGVHNHWHKRHSRAYRPTGDEANIHYRHRVEDVNILWGCSAALVLEEFGWFGGILEEFVREKHCSG
ncbi:early nodulin-like protein 1 [Miscanthus floridulus]|uniref:early nodulin-like protein 1 n=1 Tax=Miscanthus floridulus TaxID=154761 RepID=UPI0034578D36